MEVGDSLNGFKQEMPLIAHMLLNAAQHVLKAQWRLSMSCSSELNLSIYGDTTIMSTFDNRQKGFEGKFAHDQELQFKAGARRNKLLGLWAAGLMGKEGDAALAYAKEVIKADFEEAGDDDVFRKVRADFDAASVDQSDHQLRRQMDELLAEAISQIEKEG